MISIHAPRTGSDQGAVQKIKPPDNFNPRSPHGERRGYAGSLSRLGAISIHAPRTGSDPMRVMALPVPIFQSTLPARGATGWRCSSGCRSCDFNPRSPHGERRFVLCALFCNLDISIHAPRTGSDLPADRAVSQIYHFNPRSPHGERRKGSQPRESPHHISIHAPRTGSDVSASPLATLTKKFQSTLPARGATRCKAAVFGKR